MAGERHNRMSQSNYSTLGVQLLWAALVVGGLEIGVEWSNGSFDLAHFPFAALFGFLIWWYLITKVAAGRTWALIVSLVFTILGVIALFSLTAMVSQLPGLPITRGLILLEALRITLLVTSLVLLFATNTSAGKIVLVIGGVLVIAAGTAVFLVPRVLSELSSDPKSPLFLMRVANEVKQEHKFPWMVDDDTQAFDVKGQPGMLVYYYRLVKVNATDFDAHEFLDRMKPAVTEQFCSHDDKGLFKQGVVVRAAYVDKSNVAIGSLDVNPGDCEAAATNAPAHHEVWKKYKPQPEAQPETPWRSETPSQTSSQTPTAKPHQSVETPEAKAQALVADGNEQMQRGNYDAAIKDFQAALALEPNNYAARSGLQEAQHVR